MVLIRLQNGKVIPIHLLTRDTSKWQNIGAYESWNYECITKNQNYKYLSLFIIYWTFHYYHMMSNHLLYSYQEYNNLYKNIITNTPFLLLPASLFFLFIEKHTEIILIPDSISSPKFCFEQLQLSYVPQSIKILTDFVLVTLIFPQN